MRVPAWMRVPSLAVALAIACTATAADVVPAPLQDDAALYDVQFVGRSVVWAVGDRGVAWRSDDAGRTWKFIRTPVDCPLRSACFLTDRIGWIAGGGYVPYTRRPFGVVLFTENGGASWQVLAGRVEGRESRKGRESRVQGSGPERQGEPRGVSPRSVMRPESKVKGRRPGTKDKGHRRQDNNPQSAIRNPQSVLPNLTYVRFFSLEVGVAVGEANAAFPTGVLLTTDGGRTWRPAPGKKHSGWRTAAFASPSAGVAAGLRGRAAMIGGGRLLTPRMAPLGLRGLHDVALNPDKSGWLVGDGGLVLKTRNGGIVWESPPTELPRGTADAFDFRAVAVVRDHVWIAGSPGTVVWHSPDGGRNWQKRRTGQTVPIRRLSFADSQTGIAVGELGGILRTTDGGRNWTSIRGGGRQAALLAIHAGAGDVSFPLLVQQSAELGYRSAVLLPVRRDVGPEGEAARASDLQLAQAVSRAGGSDAVIGWRHPLDVAGLDRQREKLIGHWNSISEGRFADAMLGDLVRHIRTWRPSLIVLAAPQPGDEAAKLLIEAINRAVRDAGDATRFIEHSTAAGLEPWKVDRVYLRLPAGSTGQAHVDLHEFLSRLQTTVQLAATESAAGAIELSGPTAKREAYRLMFDRSAAAGTTNRGFFVGIPLAPGGSARRRLAAVDDDDERRLKLARRQRNFQAAAERFLDDPRFAGQLIAQLSSITRGMSSDAAALQLRQLAGEYRRRSMWNLSEATLIELIERYPTEPVAREAMRELFLLWSAAEPTWRRLQATSAARGSVVADAPTVIRRLQRIRGSLVDGLTTDPAAVDSDESLDAIVQAGHIRTSGTGERRTAAVANWQNQAIKLASLLRRVDPDLYASPEVQFPLAALLRKRGVHRLADRIYRRQTPPGDAEDWKTTARSELWLLAPQEHPPRPIAGCKSTAARPRLDGVLSDVCWQNARPIRLSTSSTEPGDAPLVMLARDDRYLYIAGSVPRHKYAPPPARPGGPRQRDADLSSADHFRLRLDVDRDYATWFELQIDSAGRTAESCFGDAAWNPKWYVAAESDETRWRFEAAIPFSELGPQPPGRRTLWAIDVRRMIPAVGVQCWTGTPSSEGRPQGFGLVRFE